MQALALSGGGSFGCFEAGVLYELLKAGYYFDKVYGTSTGAMNTVLLAQAYIDGSPEVLKTLWTKTVQENSDIYRSNSLEYLLSTPPYSFSPLRKLLADAVDFNKVVALPERFTLTAVDLVSGKTQYFSNKDSGMTGKRLFEATIASGSMPPMFDPVSLDSMKLVDGGIRNNLPITKAIEDSSEVLAVMCRPVELDESVKPFTGLLEITSRTLDVMMNKITYGDLQSILMVNQMLQSTPRRTGFLAGKRVIDVQVIAPDYGLPGGTLDFSHEYLEQGFDIGAQKGREYVQNGTFIDKALVTPELLSEVTSDQAQIFQVFPLAFDGKVLTIGVNRADAVFVNQMTYVLGHDVKVVLINRDNLARNIREYYGGNNEPATP